MPLKVDGRLAQAESRADLQSNTCALYMADVVNSMMILTIFSRTHISMCVDSASKAAEHCCRFLGGEVRRSSR